MTTVLLADDHQVLREALRFLLEAQPDFHIIAETGDGLEAVALVEKHRPDVLLVDMMMPGLNGLEVARRAKRLFPAGKVIVLSMYDAENYVVEALAAGVDAYVLKQSSSQELLAAIRQVMAGGVYLSPSLNERAVQAYIRQAHDARRADPFDLLSDREREVLQLAAEGLSNPQIAERLSLSPRTVEMHRFHLMRKLGLKTQTDLVKYAVRRGIV
jgi:DNA-binding NarL/FixJ family response regulator